MSTKKVLTATKSPKKTKKLLTNVLIGLIIVLTATENVVENKKAGAERSSDER